MDILKSEGFDAVAVSSSARFRYKFLSPEPSMSFVPGLVPPTSLMQRVKSLHWPELGPKCNPTLSLEKGDVLVVPDFAAAWLPRCAESCRFVLLVQGYHILANITMLSKWNAEVFEATVTISEACQKIAEMVGLKHIHRVPLAIDRVFYEFGIEKKKVIAYMPRRRPSEVKIVTQLLRQRGKIGQFELMPIENMSRAEVSQVLRDASIFLSFSQVEGFGLPPAEAMAAGCIVVGFDGVGGREYFDETVGFPIADGDVAAFVRTVEDVVGLCESAPERILSMRRSASNRIGRQYDKDTQRGELKRVFAEISATFVPPQ